MYKHEDATHVQGIFVLAASRFGHIKAMQALASQGQEDAHLEMDCLSSQPHQRFQRPAYAEAAAPILLQLFLDHELMSKAVFRAFP